MWERERLTEVAVAGRREAPTCPQISVPCAIVELRPDYTSGISSTDEHGRVAGVQVHVRILRDADDLAVDDLRLLRI